MKVTLCRGCALGQTGFATVLSRALSGAGVTADIALADCMSGCARASTLAFRAPGKTAFLFGDLVEADLADLLRFAQAYDRSQDGTFDDARPFGGLRHKALARIPA